MKKKEFHPTLTQKQRILPHIRYEIEMLVYCEKARRDDQKQNSTQKQNTAQKASICFKKNLLIESTLLHCRNLYQFLCQNSKRFIGFNEDVWASDYDYSILTLNLPEKHRKSINKYLAHLSYLRKDVSPVWPSEELIGPILEKLLAFCKHLLERKNYLKDLTECKKWEKLQSDLKVLSLPFSGVAGVKGTFGVFNTSGGIGATFACSSNEAIEPNDLNSNI